jgi:glycine betaine catabolism B
MFRILGEWMQDMGRYPTMISAVRREQRGEGGTDFLAEHLLARQQRLVEALHPTRMRLRVEQVIDETPTTRTFRTRRVDGALPPFRAGRYVNLYVELAGVRTSRPYSISSRPGADHLDLTVRDVPGGFVAPHLLGSVSAGDEIETSGPTGCFYHEPLIHGSELVMLAGGSGITPLASMVRDQAARDWPCRVTLLYGSRDPGDVIFGDEFERLAAASDRFRYVPVISEPPDRYEGRTGLLDEACIREVVPEVQGRTFYLCGPAAMYDFCLPALERLGVPGFRVKRELYGPPEDVTALPGWPAGLPGDAVFTVDVGERIIEARAGEPLLCSLERAGVAAPTVCRSGECSLCRTRLLGGEAFTPPGSGVRESDREHGWIHPCVTYPLSNMTIRIPGGGHDG